MNHVLKALATHIISGNFATASMASFFNEANAVEVSAFAPQRDMTIVAGQCQQESIQSMEWTMNITANQRTKINTSIFRIGAIKSTKDILSLCVNI